VFYWVYIFSGLNTNINYRALRLHIHTFVAAKATFISYRQCPLSEGNIDRPGSGGIAEPIIQPGPTAGVLVARATASAAVTETDVGGCRQALSVRSVEAPGVAIVNRAISTADIVRASIAVDNPGVQSRTVGKRVGRVDVRNIRQFGVGSREPVVELGIGDYACRNLDEKSVGQLDGLVKLTGSEKNTYGTGGDASCQESDSDELSKD
jgi:hypothetical protein